MRLPLAIITGVFFVTFMWGVLVRVLDGTMTMSQYTQYYCREVSENFKYLGDIAQRKLVKPALSPLDIHRRELGAETNSP